MADITRRQFVSSASLGTVGLLRLSRSAGAWESHPTGIRGDAYVIIDTPRGKRRGTRDDGVSIFRGVPYARTV